MVTPLEIGKAYHVPNKVVDEIVDKLRATKGKPMDWKLALTAVKFAGILGVKTLEYYQGALHGLVTDLIRGAVTEDQFLSFGYQLIEDQITEAWFEGLGRNGFDVENMTSDWWDHLNGIIAREQDYFQGFTDDLMQLGEQEGMEAALSRADLYAQRYIDIENQAWLYTSAAAETFVWAMGATEQHCPECAALDGWVATAQEWQESGINPQMPPNEELTCGGWRCDCRLEKTDAPSMGSPRDALEAVKTWGDIARLPVKGDVPGHEFHGNQWTGGGGTVVVWHGTALKFLDSIREEGLRVSPDNRTNSPALYKGERGQSVYVTTDIEKARSYAQAQGRNFNMRTVGKERGAFGTYEVKQFQYAILRFEVPREIADSFKVDKASPSSFRYKGTISGKYLTGYTIGTTTWGGANDGTEEEFFDLKGSKGGSTSTIFAVVFLDGSSEA